MSDDWKPGDLALCVDDSPPRRKYFVKRGWTHFPLRRGQILTVRAVTYPEKLDEGPGLLFDGICAGRYEKTGSEMVFDPRRFRKIHPHTPDEQDEITIRLLRGENVGEPA